jgi:DNA-binding transcriptional regulator YdaS (Cro superfamily)
MKNITTAIHLCGSQLALAKACGVSQPAVAQWAKGGKISGEHVLAISRATRGAVTPHDLRPDLYEAAWIPSCVTVEHRKEPAA